MKWTQLFQTVPGQELAQNVLDANMTSVLGLVIVLLVVVIIVIVLAVLAMMYFNSKGIATMATTQKEMSISNAQWAVSDSKKTEALGRSVDELTMFRQDYATNSISQRNMAEQTQRDVVDHEKRSEERTRSIVEQVAAVDLSIREALTEAVSTVKADTLEAVTPALEAIDKLALLTDAFGTRQEATMDLMGKKHEEEMRFLREQHETHMRVWRDQLTQAQHQILEGLKQTQEKADHDTSVQDLPPLRTLGPAESVPAADGVDPDATSTRPGR